MTSGRGQGDGAALSVMVVARARAHSEQIKHLRRLAQTAAALWEGHFMAHLCDVML